MTHVNGKGTVQPRSRAGHGVRMPGDGRHLQVSSEVMHSSNSADTSSVMHVVGDVDCTTSCELRAEINQLLTSDHRARLILDLKGVTRIDSSGVGALLEGSRDANKRHVRFTLSGLNGSLHRMLERTRLIMLFDVRPTVEEALEK
jgi:anti-sigma B factor antagonist